MEATAADQPMFAGFDGLAKSKESKARKLMRALEELERVQTEKGPVMPQVLAAVILGVSSQRVGELLDAGRMEVVRVGGQRWILTRSFRKFLAERPRKGGRPKLKEAFERGQIMGDAIGELADSM